VKKNIWINDTEEQFGGKEATELIAIQLKQLCKEIVNSYLYVGLNSQ